MIMKRADIRTLTMYLNTTKVGAQYEAGRKNWVVKMIATILSFRDMEAFLKTGKVGAGAGGSKPMAKEKKEKKQAPVSYIGWL